MCHEWGTKNAIVDVMVFSSDIVGERRPTAESDTRSWRGSGWLSFWDLIMHDSINATRKHVLTSNIAPLSLTSSTSDAVIVFKFETHGGVHVEFYTYKTTFASTENIV